MAGKKPNYEIPAQYAMDVIASQRNESQDRLSHALALVRFLEERLAETEQKLITATIQSKGANIAPVTAEKVELPPK